MNSRQTPVQFVFFLALAMLSGPTSAQQTRPASASGRVSILLITVDDMNWDSPGCFGGAAPDITPNIDRMAAEGMRFTDAHVTIAVCTPSRSVLLTGMYPHHNGAEGFQRIRPDVPTLPAVLGEAGFMQGMSAAEKAIVFANPMDQATIRAAARGEALTTVIMGLWLSLVPTFGGAVLLGLALMRRAGAQRPEAARSPAP